MIDLVKIDGVSYDLLVTAVEETFEVVEGGNSGIALYRQREIRDLAGVKIGHKITFSPPDNNPAAIDELVTHLFGTLREFITLEVVHNQDVISYEAAYNTATRRVAHIDDATDTVYWDELTVEFRPIEAQVNG